MYKIKKTSRQRVRAWEVSLTDEKEINAFTNTPCSRLPPLCCAPSQILSQPMMLLTTKNRQKGNKSLINLSPMWWFGTKLKLSFRLGIMLLLNRPPQSRRKYDHHHTPTSIWNVKIFQVKMPLFRCTIFAAIWIKAKFREIQWDKMCWANRIHCTCKSIHSQCKTPFLKTKTHSSETKLLFQWADTESYPGFSIQNIACIESWWYIAESDSNFGRTSWSAREQWVRNGDTTFRQ